MGSKDISIDVAELAGIIAEGPLFGIFLAFDVAAIYILVGRRRHSGLNVPMTIAAVVMLGLALAQYVVDSVNIFMGFIPLERDARLQFFADITQPIFAAKHAIYFTMLFVGDAIVIYRAYIVWNSNVWVAILPALCSLASAASAYQTIYAVRHPPKNLTAEFGDVEFHVGFAIFSLSLAANTISTGLIAYKIWSIDRGLKRSMVAMSPHTRRIPIARIIIESGALNTAYILIYTIVLNNGTHGIETVACIVTPLVGIIFTTVIIRVTLAADAQKRSTHSVSKQAGPQISVQRYVSTSQDVTFTAGLDSGIELTHKHSDYPYRSSASSEPFKM